jgi:hypothetical protein
MGRLSVHERQRRHSRGQTRSAEVIRPIYLNLGQGLVVSHCLANKIGIASIDSLPKGGTKIVCRTADGFGVLRRQLKLSLLKGSEAL